jgi:hypothetical protein
VTRRAPAILLCALTCLLTILTSTVGIDAADAASTPYSDPNVAGFIGLCDRSGNPMTHGSITDKPFVWRAVSSAKAPTNYQITGRTATLAAFQPRNGVDADLWSGDILTASSNYTNPQVPMAQATSQDFSLADFLAEFPARWNGLIQLRILYGAPNEPTTTTPYPATDIRISGKSWSTVDGGAVSCTAGDAISPETVLQSSAGSGTSPGAAESSGSAKAHPTASTSPHGTASASSGADPVAAQLSNHAGSRRSSQSVLPWAALLVLAAAVVAVGGAVALWRRHLNA